MNPRFYFRSLTQELECLKDRVRHFIDHNHPPSDGEWKESVLRAMLSQRLPDTVKVGRGFILRQGRPSTQCDVLLYRADHPIPFKDGDLVFVPCDAVLGVIEVKSRLSRAAFRRAATKLAEVGSVFPRGLKRPALCLFAYEAQGRPSDWLPSVISEVCTSADRKIDLVSVGCDHFVKWWDRDPVGPTDQPYHKWHSYFLEGLAAGYFIANVIDLATEGLVSRNENIWYPNEGKEAVGLPVVIEPGFETN